MPNYLRGENRDVLSFVLINALACYGWRTKNLSASLGISSGDLSTQLGHMTAVQADAIANRIMFTGANSPKPARATKIDRTAPTTQKGSTSTFIAYDKGAAATSAGWRLGKRQRGVSLSANTAGKRSITAIAELSNGILYAFPMNASDFASFGASLGLADASSITTSTERNKLVSGSKTKPGKARLEDSAGTFSSYFSTADESTAIAAGFNIVETELIEYAAAGTP